MKRGSGTEPYGPIPLNTLCPLSYFTGGAAATFTVGDSASLEGSIGLDAVAANYKGFVLVEDISNQFCKFVLSVQTNWSIYPLLFFSP